MTWWSAGADEPAGTPEVARVVLSPILQVRPRFEGHGGRDGAVGGEVAVVLQRTRLGLNGAWRWLSARAMVQDVRAWGEEGDTLRDFAANGLDLHEGWLAVQGGPVRLTVGRQEIQIHEDRLIGSVPWAQQGRSFDGGRLKWDHQRFHGELIGAWLASTYTVAAWEQPGGMGIARAGYHDEHVVADVLAVVEDQRPIDRTRATVGAWVKGSVGIVTVKAESYAQVGRVGEDELRAWLAAGSVAVAPEVVTRPVFTVGYDHLSGDTAPDDGVVTSFDTLYATNYKFYGISDVVNPGPMGIGDLLGVVSLTPFGRANLRVEAHFFLRTDTMAARAGEVSGVLSVPLLPTFAGERPEAAGRGVVEWRVKPSLNVQIGGAAYVPVDGGSADGWGYVMLDAQL